METENYIAKEIKEGNRLAFTMAFEKYHRAIYFFAYKYIGNQTVAEDIVQYTFLKLWEKRREINTNCNFVGYLYSIAKNHTLNCIRNQNIANHGNDYYYQQMPKAVVSESETESVDNEMLVALRRSITKLSPHKQAILDLKLNKGLSNNDIALRLNISINTVKVQYNRSLKELRRLMEGEKPSQ